MKITSVWIAAICVGAMTVAAEPPPEKKLAPPPDWKAFDDPEAILLTDAFAESVNGLPAADKTAAMQRLKESLKAKQVEIRRRTALTLAALGDKSGIPT